MTLITMRAAGEILNVSWQRSAVLDFTTSSYFWPCDPLTPIHDTFREVTARRIYCIGSRCIGRVLGLAQLSLDRKTVVRVLRRRLTQPPRSKR
jgi:hypothetical protein